MYFCLVFELNMKVGSFISFYEANQVLFINFMDFFYLSYKPILYHFFKHILILLKLCVKIQSKDFKQQLLIKIHELRFKSR